MASRTARRRVGNLPAERTSFVDRRQECVDVRQSLSIARMVTLTGVGGVGKTRLALRVAAQLGRSYRDGGWLVELAEVHDDDLVVHTVAQTLGIQDWSARGVEHVLADYVRDKEILVVLDNCEQVLDGCVKACAVLLDAAPELRILATSRQPLDVYGEHVVVVSTLPVPDGRPDGADAGNSVRLFAERASAAGFQPAAADNAAVAQLCRELDGIPLAIELAAARTRFLSVDELLARIGDRFQLLAGNRSALPRHQTLRATMDWSYELCSAEERLLWSRMSVFAGGVDLAAAEDVCSGSGLGAEAVLELMAALVDKSILTREPGPAGTTRYRLLATVREYGRSLLADDERTQLRTRHRDHYLALAEQGAREWFGPDQLAWRDRIAAEHDNLRAALEFCATQPGQVQEGLRLAGALWFYWTACGLIAEGRKWLDRLLALDTTPTAPRATALWVCSWLASHQGDLERGRATAEGCSAVAEHLKDAGLAAFGLHLRGVDAMAEGHLEEASSLTTRAWSYHRTHPKITSPMVMSLVQSGLVACLRGETDRATAYAQECLQLTAKTGELWTRSWGLVVRGLASWMRGDADDAVVHLRASIGIKIRFNDLFGLGMAAEVLAWSHVSRGEHARAARLFGVLDRLWQLVGVPLMGAQQLLEYRSGAERRARAALGESAFGKLVAETANLSILEGLAAAIREKPQPPDSTPAPQRGPLTRREFQVAEAIAQGLSNKEIAARLVISQRTAEAHVEHILTKLDFGSRTQVAAWIAGQHEAAT
ncbi:ATP-binding protein [Saccharopolyspora antimicrobica]|uniref:Non-specific serine/threonine protein kinase n=1 Tax=Saccharopolyspora antimicrobica TaxID=455193 RepID=A0ABX9TN27_9PSEU|nr:LuxR C-terminal-related transcriptional regulator [Saccharopolyspora antimicrobica]RKT88231.1 non-specific serine/threonine protein kinase [Saccharopolyspora antimicrobica]